jgi:hypothetical protein
MNAKEKKIYTQGLARLVAIDKQNISGDMDDFDHMINSFPVLRSLLNLLGHRVMNELTPDTAEYWQTYLETVGDTEREPLLAMLAFKANIITPDQLIQKLSGDTHGQVPTIEAVQQESNAKPESREGAGTPKEPSHLRSNKDVSEEVRGDSGRE